MAGVFGGPVAVGLPSVLRHACWCHGKHKARCKEMRTAQCLNLGHLTHAREANERKRELEHLRYNTREHDSWAWLGVMPDGRRSSAPLSEPERAGALSGQVVSAFCGTQGAVSTAGVLCRGGQCPAGKRVTGGVPCSSLSIFNMSRSVTEGENSVFVSARQNPHHLLCERFTVL